MKVRELIAELEKVDREMEVFVMDEYLTPVRAVIAQTTTADDDNETEIFLISE